LPDERFSHPYVDWKERIRANNQMLEYLASNDIEAFTVLAKKYEVTFVLVKGGMKKRLMRAGNACLEPMLFNEVVSLYRVRCVSLSFGGDCQAVFIVEPVFEALKIDVPTFSLNFYI
jgi:hypothetical protein